MKHPIVILAWAIAKYKNLDLDLKLIEYIFKYSLITEC